MTLALVPGVGGTRFVRLMARFGTPKKVLAAAESELAEVVGKSVAKNIRQYRDAVDAETQERLMRLHGATLVTMDDPAYPALLAEIYDPPLMLFTRGGLLETDQYAVAIVGTRHPSHYGTAIAEQLAGDLAARGITVVSGMAEGIDAAAHEGALKAGGRTIAVVGSGVDQVFPAAHADLMRRIIAQGAVVSPFPMGMSAHKTNFPQRNRIISGISLGTVVVEAPPGSGSLITAKHAAEQGREVFAVPGEAGRPNSRGPHALIREGARLVETVEDILVELRIPSAAHAAPGSQTAPAEGQDTTPPPAPSAPGLTALEADILASLSAEGAFVDEIALTCRRAVSETLSALTILELKGLVRQHSGKRFSRA
ncbi:MAG: DNA-protecting protein DprA [Candidatus Hydrogenedentes bacterium]|nr:DNA-protecting protein DprA [Candidatus Hydrogenedentota bacterium]